MDRAGLVVFGLNLFCLTTLFFYHGLRIKPGIISFVFFIAGLGFLAGSRAWDLDYANYRGFFLSTPSPSEVAAWGDLLSGHGDILFGFFMSVSKGLTDDFEVFVYFVAFSSVAINLLCFYRFSPLPLLSLYLYVSYYFFVKDMGLMRAGLASAILLYGLCSLNKIRYVFVAAGVHIGAMCGILAILFKENSLLRRYPLYVLLGCACFSFLITPDHFSSFWGRISNYVGTEFSSSIGLFSPVVLKNIFFWLLFLKMLDREDAQLVNIYGFVVCWSVLFSNFAILSSRVSNFILPLEFILLPRLVNRHRGFFSMAILYGFGMAIANIMVYRYFPDPMMFIFD